MTRANALMTLEGQMDDFGLDVMARVAMRGLALSDSDLIQVLQSARASGLPVAEAVEQALSNQRLTPA